MDPPAVLPCFVIAAASGFAGPAAEAAETPAAFDSEASAKRFGESGQLVVSGVTQLTLQQVWQSPSAGTKPSTMFFVAPSADYFVLRGFSLGARVYYAHQWQGGSPSYDSVAAGPRLGYNIRLGKSFSLWPDVYATYGTGWFGGASIGQTIIVGGYAPLLYHPVPHFFAGIGPNVSGTYAMPAQNSGRALETTELGLSATLGGWVEP